MDVVWDYPMKEKAMHTHTLDTRYEWGDDGHSRMHVFCTGCDIKLRLATKPEAVWVNDMDMFRDDGPMIGPMNVIVVPENFSIMVAL